MGTCLRGMRMTTARDATDGVRQRLRADPGPGDDPPAARVRGLAVRVDAGSCGSGSCGVVRRSSHSRSNGCSIMARHAGPSRTGVACLATVVRRPSPPWLHYLHAASNHSSERPAGAVAERPADELVARAHARRHPAQAHGPATRTPAPARSCSGTSTGSPRCAPPTSPTHAGLDLSTVSRHLRGLEDAGCSPAPPTPTTAGPRCSPSPTRAATSSSAPSAPAPTLLAARDRRLVRRTTAPPSPRLLTRLAHDLENL